MSGAYSGSELTYSSALDLSSLPPTEAGFVSSELYSFFPETSVKDQHSDITFNYNASSQHYIQPDSSYIYLKCRILKYNGDNLSTSDMVAPCHNIGAAVFNSCDFYMNDTLISRSNNLYSYKVHLQDLLNTTTTYKGQVLSATQMYIEDNSILTNSAQNTGFAARFILANKSKHFELCLKPNEPIFQCNRLIPPNVSFRMVLRRSPPQFALVGVDERTSSSTEPFPFALHIDTCVFFMKRHVVLPEIQNHHLSILSRANSRLNYPVKNKWIKSFIIPPNTSSVQSQVLFSHNIPSSIVLAFAPTDQVNGTIESSPFFLEDCALEYIQVKTEGDLNNTFEINMDDTKDLHLQAFQSLSLSQRNNMIGNGISVRHTHPYYQYKYNFCVFFELITTTNPDAFVVPKKGQVKVDLRLKSTPKSITCIVLGQLDSLIQIGKNYEIFGDINII